MKEAPFFFLLLLPFSPSLSAQAQARTEITAKAGSSIRPIIQGPVTIPISHDPALKDLSSVRLDWEVTVNGLPRQKGTTLNLPLALQRSQNLRIPVHVTVTAGDEVFLQLHYRLKKEAPPLPAGYRVAGQQLLLKKPMGADLSVHPDGILTLGDEGGIFTVNSPQVRLQFNKQTGWLQHYEAKGTSLLGDSTGLRSNFWRAPADTPSASGSSPSPDPWKQVTNTPHLQLFSTSTSSELVIVRADYELPEVFCTMHVRYTINAKGEMQVEQSLDADSVQKGPMLSRFGMQWALPAGFDSVTWYGEALAGKSGAPGEPGEIAIYRQTIEEVFSGGSDAQERTAEGVRWWKLTNREGRGLLIHADSSLLRMSRPSSREQPIEAAGLRQHVLNIDHAQPGVLAYGSVRYSYKVTPF